MEIYLVRHGETDWNAQGKLQGREDLPLNGNGKRQAMACGVALSEAGFTAIYSGPLRPPGNSLYTTRVASRRTPR